MQGVTRGHKCPIFLLSSANRLYYPTLSFFFREVCTRFAHVLHLLKTLICIQFLQFDCRFHTGTNKHTIEVLLMIFLSYDNNSLKQYMFPCLFQNMLENLKFVVDIFKC